MKKVAAEPYREIDFSGAKRGPVIPAEPGKARISYAGRVRPSVGIRYPATLDRQTDGRHLVQFVDLAEAFTEGKTKKEALFNAAEVLSAILALRLDAGQDVPAPSQKIRGASYIAPDAKTQTAMLRLSKVPDDQ